MPDAEARNIAAWLIENSYGNGDWRCRAKHGQAKCSDYAAWKEAMA